MTSTAAILLVDDDPSLLLQLAQAAALRAAVLESAASLGDLDRALGAGPFDVAVVNIGLASGAGIEAIRRIRHQSPDIEILVVSQSALLPPAVLSGDLSACGFIQKPFGIDRLMAALDRPLERRRMYLQNQRLVWELQTINEVGDVIARSLELQDVLAGALQCVVSALAGVGGSIRLKDPISGVYDLSAAVGSPLLQRMWVDHGLRAFRPSDRVIATRAAILIEDLLDVLPAGSAVALPCRSAVSVPMMTGDELLGTLTIGSSRPHRFGVADQRLLSIVAAQMGVAVQNARLHDSVVRAKREWEQTFDAIGDPIAVFDHRGELLRGNVALASHLKRDVRDLRGAGCGEVGLCSGGADCTVASALANDASRAEVSLADGRIFSVTTFPVGGGAEGASVVQVAKNVTDEIRSARRLRQMSEELASANAHSTAALERLKAAQAQLLQAEKLSAIGQLVAGVAHELNNPLTSVIGYAQLLEEEVADGLRTPEGQAQFTADLRRITVESERAARIVRNLLAFARRQTASRERQDLAELCGRVLALRTYELRLNSVELQTAFEPGLPKVVADAGQLQQALLNLVLNAEQAMRHSTERRLRVGTRFDEAAAAVELFITDTGHGIEPANLSKVFDPFFTTRDVGEGTGLGLSICYGIVRDHGGQISVDSIVGEGTTFSVLLPACVEDPAQSGAILVAHLDQGERDYLAAALAGWGFNVITAATSSEALGHCRDHRLHAFVAGRNVLAADLDAWRALRRAAAPTPLILVSMSADDSEVERFGREHASAVLAPPFPLRAIRAAVGAVAREYV